MNQAVDIWQHYRLPEIESSPAVPTLSRSAIVNYTAQQMFALVADIDAYPQFLPWCRGATSRLCDDQSTVATLEIAKGPVRQSFTTRNINTPHESIHMQLVEGPFAHLQGCWTFLALDDSGSRVSLEIDFRFANALIRGAFGKVFNHISGEMVNAFCERANAIYG